MSITLNPYFSFKDNARQAIEFYLAVFDGQVTINTFGEYHMSEDPDEQDKIMHAVLKTPQGLTIMASDSPKGMPFEPGHSVNVSLSGPDEDELTELFNKLCEGGVVTMPMSDAPWGDKFGMVTDKFGINWLVNIGEPR